MVFALPARAEDTTHTVAWSAAPAVLGVAEAVVEQRLAHPWSAQGLGAIGNGSTAVFRTDQVRGLTLLQGNWFGQIGGQLRRYAVGDFRRGVWIAGELRAMAVAHADQPVVGLALGPLAGVKAVWGPGLTTELAVGGAVVANTLQQRGRDARIWSFSVQPMVQLLLGWSW